MILTRFNFRQPDYVKVFKFRTKLLAKIKSSKVNTKLAKDYYKNNIAEFISTFGMTYEPRNPERGLPSIIPFILFEKQSEWVNWIIHNWKNQLPGITEKTRDMGMSWLSISLAVSLCLFNDGLVIGFGSRKAEYVDKRGDMKALFPKMRFFIENLPKVFTKGIKLTRDATYMIINFPNGSQIIGESGDNIGRGARASIYFVDEAAFLERPFLVDASLSATTNCRQDISTPNGNANSFAIRRKSGKIKVFTFHWRNDPRKDEAWYLKMKYELDPVTVAQEIDIDYAASVEGVIIPSLWVQAAVDAHIKLGIEPSGIRKGAWDVADEGKDSNAFCGRHGILINHISEWSGVNGDILQSAHKVFNLCDEYEIKTFIYDADGLGAAAKGDSRQINANRPGNPIKVISFRGSAEVQDPTGELIKGRTNKDLFANAKAQAWWMLRIKFQNTYRALNEGLKVNPEDIISISSKLPLLVKLTSELSQPTFEVNNNGKILVNKKPDGTKSPNLADAVMMAFALVQNNMKVNPAVRSRLMR